MKFSLKVTVRSRTGKAAARQLRRAGTIPGVIYGRGEESIPVQTDAKGLKQLLSGLGARAPLVEVQLEDQPKFRAIVKAIQRNPITDELFHIDLQRIHPKEAITIGVPIQLTGQSPGVKTGGILDQHLHEIPVRGLPAHIPGRIEVDISNLKSGHSIHLSDLKLEKVEPLHPPETPVVSVLVPKLAAEAKPVPTAPPAEEAPTPTEG